VFSRGVLIILFTLYRKKSQQLAVSKETMMKKLKSYKTSFLFASVILAAAVLSIVFFIFSAPVIKAF